MAEPRRPVRFHLDESAPPAVAHGLRLRRFDATTPMDTGLRSATDVAHLAFAHQQGRVIVTHDADFLRLHAEGVPHSGIDFCRIQSRSIGDIIRALEELALAHDADEMRDRVDFI